VIVRFQRCVGVKLFRLFNWQLEVWCCPKDEKIPMHYHANCDSRIIHLLGKMTWYVPTKSKRIGWSDIGWNRKIPAGSYHGAWVHSKLAVFANLERWKTKPTSAAKDFVYG